MQRTKVSFTIIDAVNFKQQMLSWANQFNICCFLDSHGYADDYHSYDCLLAVEALRFFSPQKNILSSLHSFMHGNNDWLFGHIGYGLADEAEVTVSSSITNQIEFPAIFLFQPAIVIEVMGNRVTISSAQKLPADILKEIENYKIDADYAAKVALNIQPRIDKEDYIKIIEQLQSHILRGDCYEINYCQEFFAEHAIINPLEVYRKLTQLSPTPFAGYYKLEDQYLLCASPERYLKKTGEKIISQPIKGTIKRNVANSLGDEQLKLQLFNSIKDRSENVMVVDLVRNDLSKICKEASVTVEELFGIYSFPQVHQMISTITGLVEADTNFADIISATFPMGSMTGAPKKAVMNLVKTYERSKRGIYSGCIGYITPANNFDFNVVIRSIMYNAANKYLSYQVGGGITFYSDANKEYEECLLKAAAIKKVLQ